MKKTTYLLVFVVTLVFGFAFGEEYKPKVILEGKWGSGPGEFGFTMWEGEPDYPESFIIDNQGYIYIFDHINNRIQKFNINGKYISSIFVESYKRSTKKEVEGSKKTWNKMGFYFATVYAKRIYVDEEDSLFFEQNKMDGKGKKGVNYIKYDRKGKKTDTDKIKFGQVKKLWRNKELLVEKNEIIGQNQNIIINNLKTGKKHKIKFKLKYSNTKINSIKTDKKNNIYVFTKWPPQVYKYDETANQISVIELLGLPNPYGKHPLVNSVPVVDGQGNIYQMGLIPNPDKQVEYIPAESIGLRIIKWEIK